MPSSAAETSTRRSRVDDVYDWLVKAITGFELPAGSPLLENTLARELRVSRTPVREALQRLEREGLVQRTASTRFAVALPSVRDIREACDAIEVLDTYLFQRASENLTEEQGAELDSLVTAMTAAAEADDMAAWAEADRRFHAILAAASDNQLVADLVRQVRRRVQRFWLGQARGDRLVGCSAEHAELTHAVRNGIVDAIPPLVDSHVAHMRESLLTLLEHASLLFSGGIRAAAASAERGDRP